MGGGDSLFVLIGVDEDEDEDDDDDEYDDASLSASSLLKVNG